jgi:hypothetical protein
MTKYIYMNYGTGYCMFIRKLLVIPLMFLCVAWTPTPGKIFLAGNSMAQTFVGSSGSLSGGWEEYFIMFPPKNPATNTAFITGTNTALSGSCVNCDNGSDWDKDGTNYATIASAAPEWIIVYLDINDLRWISHAPYDGTVDSVVTSFSEFFDQIKSDCSACKIIYLSQNPGDPDLVGGLGLLGNVSTDTPSAYDCNTSDTLPPAVVYCSEPLSIPCECYQTFNANMQYFVSRMKTVCQEKGIYFADPFNKMLRDYPTPTLTGYASAWVNESGTHWKDYTNTATYGVKAYLQYIKPALEEALSGIR